MGHPPGFPIPADVKKFPLHPPKRRPAGSAAPRHTVWWLQSAKVLAGSLQDRSTKTNPAGRRTPLYLSVLPADARPLPTGSPLERCKQTERAQLHSVHVLDPSPGSEAPAFPSGPVALAPLQASLAFPASPIPRSLDPLGWVNHWGPGRLRNGLRFSPAKQGGAG